MEENYLILIVGYNDMGIPVPNKEIGCKQCYEYYKKGIPLQRIKLLKIGNSYEDQTYFDIETYIKKMVHSDSRKKAIDADFVKVK